MAIFILIIHLEDPAGLKFDAINAGTKNKLGDIAKGE
jgi:hypothetical protein